MPVGLGVVLVATRLPCVDLLCQGLPVWDPPVEALTCEHAEFGFGHVQPTTVPGRVVPLEALDETARLGGRESLIE